MTQTPPNAEDPRPDPVSDERPGAETRISLGAPEALDEARIRTGLSDQEVALVQALPRGSALLLVPRGPGAGSRFLLDTDRITVGRDEHSDIFLDDVTVSRKHVEFVRELDDYRVRDVGSLNGTYVNRERIDSSLLVNGDEVQIGKYRLVYYQRTGQPDASEAGPADAR